jgi:hypothetical protein
METTNENKIEVTYQEAWISTLRPSVEFTLNDVKLEATGTYYNDDGIDDIEVRTADDHWVYFQEGDEEYEVGKALLEEMDLNKHLTF